MFLGPTTYFGLSMSLPPKGSKIEFFNVIGELLYSLSALEIRKAYRAAKSNPPTGITSADFPTMISVNFYCTNCELGKIVLSAGGAEPLRMSMHRLGYNIVGKLK